MRQAPSTLNLGPGSPKKWAEVSLPAQGPHSTGMETGRQSQGTGTLFGSGCSWRFPAGNAIGAASSSAGGSGTETFWEVLLLGGHRLYLAERREPWRVRGRRDFPGGLHGSPLLLPALPLPTCWSPGPSDLGTLLVPQGQAHSSPHGTEKGWLLPSPVPHLGAAGTGMTPLPAAHGCRWGAGSYSTRGITPCCHPKTQSTGTRALKPWAWAARERLPHTASRPWEHTGPSVFPGTANTCLDASLPAQPTHRALLLPVQCCQVLPPRTKPPLVAQWRRMTQSSSGADIGGLASGSPSTGTPLRARTVAAWLSPPGDSCIVCWWDHPEHPATGPSSSGMRHAGLLLGC